MHMRFGINIPVRSDTLGNLNEAAPAFLNPNQIHISMQPCDLSRHTSEAQLEAEGVLK